jgi:hypothetical protein
MPAISSTQLRSCLRSQASIVGPLSYPGHHCPGLIGQIKKTKSHVQSLCLPEGVGSNNTVLYLFTMSKDPVMEPLRVQHNQTCSLFLTRFVYRDRRSINDPQSKSIPNYVWWSLTGSNRRHPACKAGALPAELRPHSKASPFQSSWTSKARTPATFGRPAGGSCDPRGKQMVGPGRLELPTSRLSGVRSNHLSYGPETQVSTGT